MSYLYFFLFSGVSVYKYRQLFYLIGNRKMRDVLLNQKDDGLCTLYTSAVVDGFTSTLLDTLDSGPFPALLLFFRFTSLLAVAKECGHPGVAARTLANIADVLGAMSGGTGGLRSGPAGNKQWATAFALLEV
jgi:fucokinase